MFLMKKFLLETEASLRKGDKWDIMFFFAPWGIEFRWSANVFLDFRKNKFDPYESSWYVFFQSDY